MHDRGRERETHSGGEGAEIAREQPDLNRIEIRTDANGPPQRVRMFEEVGLIPNSTYSQRDD